MSFVLGRIAVPFPIRLRRIDGDAMRPVEFEATGDKNVNDTLAWA